MDRLEIAHRPMRKEPDENIYMLGIPLTIVLCSLGVALVAHDRGLKVVAFFLSIMMALFVLLLLPGFWELKRYNRNYPNTLQKHLNSPLSPKDYENVCYIAKWHPEVQPWIA